MKIKFFTTAFCMLLSYMGSAYAETTPSKDSTKKTSDKGTVIVPVIKDFKSPKLRMPGLPIYVVCWVDGESFRVEAPENIYIDSASLELMTSPWGYWPSIAGDGTGCTIEFDGIPGEYKLVLMENEVEYVGYFTLE
jgi:hypothetical protein